MYPIRAAVSETFYFQFLFLILCVLYNHCRLYPIRAAVSENFLLLVLVF